MYQKLCELMEPRGETAYQVSKATGISQTTISNWKAGIAKPGTKSLVALAKHFEVSVDYFIGDEKEDISGQSCEMCKAMEVFKGLKWQEQMALDFDRETNTILVDEDLLMHYIQLANPDQPKRKLHLYVKRVTE